MEAKKIILFDGVCNLCNGAVQFIIKQDKRSVFKFASLQSEIGKQLTKEHGIDTELLDSIILIEPGIAYYSKSTAALEIMKSFGGIWNLTRLFTVLPEGFRDIVYDFIAKNRYKWFGKKDACMIPTPELQSRFLD
ncbi:thiol-disulfide oxidoreductase DCC family protein [Croceivirga sp. JEA036]|uniref:thiol-disulfide oxidoreductase DCC family protein n=1 Tax=Croceivirga sp. JEA036 TaxID=2721162 RepID=UPI0014390C61|nr:thiol-disulfide oxidoreductase DCC family protein [Croceivirga sp. JEA036]NJB35712.1 thiol-disulfide oxidoreductase DCC family protein [Croceivirga sp. JEA036]